MLVNDTDSNMPLERRETKVLQKRRCNLFTTWCVCSQLLQRHATVRVVIARVVVARVVVAQPLPVILLPKVFWQQSNTQPYGFE